MSKPHRIADPAPTPAIGLWPLRRGQARRLNAAAGARVLWVEQGRVWATRTASHPGQADDLWLATGQAAELPPGSEWVIEPWPEARVALLLPPTAAD
jgi:hypothetical protein